MTKKITSVILVLCLLVSVIPVFTISASAAPINMVTYDGEAIRTALESDGDFTIKLNGNSKWTGASTKDKSCSCKLGKGTKSIDLNGYQLCGNIKNTERWYEKPYMIEVPTGSTLIISDSSAKQTGELYFDGYIRSGTYGAAGTHSANYFTDDVIYRNGIYVYGGKLVWNGGTLVGGRSKQQYLGYGLTIDKLDRALNDIVPLNVRYDGYVYQQINCTGIKQRGGEVVINGGVIEGRGFEDMGVKYSDSTGDFSSTNTRAKAIDSDGGKLTVNYGVVRGMGCASAFSVNRGNTDFSFRAGEVSLHKVDKYLTPAPSFGSFSTTFPPVYEGGSYGSRGVSDADFDTARQVVDKGSSVTDTLTVSPRRDESLTVYVRNSLGEYPVAGGIISDGESADTLRVPLDPFWDKKYGAYDQWKNAFHSVSVRAYTYKGEPGETSGITVGGSTGSELEGLPDTEALVYKKYDADPSKLDEITVPLSALLPSNRKASDVYTVYLVKYDYLWYGQGLSHIHTYHAATRIMTVCGRDDSVVITQQPESVAGGMGTPVTFTCKVSGNPSEAWWETDPYDGSRYEADSFTGGVSTLTWSGNKGVTVRACFKGKYSTVRSDPATFTCYPASSTGTKNVTMYTGDAKHSFTPEKSIYGSAYTSRHLQKATKITVGGQTKYVFDNSYMLLNDRISMNAHNTVTFKNPVKSDAGRYRVIAKYPGGYEWHSETFVVTVKDGVSPDYITEASVYGLGDLYVGEAPPTAQDMWTGDERYSIDSVTWYGLSANGKLAMNSSVNVTLKGNNIPDSATPLQVYNFYFNNDGELPWTMYSSNRTLSGRCYKGSGTTSPTVTLTYTFNNHTYLQEALDTVTLDQSAFDLTTGQSVDIQLNGTINCPPIHGTNHYIESFSVADYTPLPAGLSMSGSGRITGTLTEAPKNKGVVVVVLMNGYLYNEISAQLTFNIFGKGSDISIDSVVHTHTYGEWEPYDEGRHTRVCSDCGEHEYAPHLWDEGRITLIATPQKQGTMTYYCVDCGAVKTATYSYEDDDENAYYIGDVNADGKVKNRDALILDRYIAGWKDYDQQILNWDAADMNRDGKIKNRDALMLDRYIAGWKDHEQYVYAVKK